jgi:hypothetical protein
MIISFSQPVFIPWGGFFCRLMASDTMVLLDESLFARGFTFVNRNRLKGPGGELWTTVPVHKIHGQRLKIHDLNIHEKAYWGKKWLNTLSHAYGKAMDYQSIANPLTEIVAQENNGFMDMICPILEFFRNILGISTSFAYQSEIGVKSSGNQLLLDLCAELKAEEVILPYFARHKVASEGFEKRGIRVRFLHYFSPVYPQFWGPYLKNLSALDLLFCMGGDSRRILENGYKLME